MDALQYCLARLIDPALADSVVGDLHEMRVRRRRTSPVKASLWYWAAAAGIVLHVMSERMKTIARDLATTRGGGSGFGYDTRHVLRMLRRSPGFTAAAIVLVALGIGASTAIFSVAHAVALRPLPFPEPDRLIRIYEAHAASGKLKEDVSEPLFHDWRTNVLSIEAAALLTDVRTRFLEGQDEDPVQTMGVSPAFFQVLGVAPALGAGFRREAEYTRQTRREVVVSYAAWQRLYGRDPAVIGRSVRFADDDDPHRIVGVMPPHFGFDVPVDFWQPFLVQGTSGPITRTWRYDRVIARLRPTATIEQARIELETLAARLAGDFPAQHGGWTVTVESLHASIVGTFARVSWLLLATVAVVLGVTYLNVGGLLLARSVARERDTAVRAALGASGWRLVRLWLTEAMILAGGGAALGVCLAWTAVAALKAAAPPGIPRLDEIALDLRTLAVAAVSAILAVVVFTLASGRARRQHVANGLRAAAPGSGGARGWHTARMALTVAQCAGAAALVVLSMLLVRSFAKLTAVDLGWTPGGVVSVALSPPMPRELARPWFRYVEWSDRLIERLERTPGIERAAISTQIPLAPQPFPSTIARGRGKTGGDSGRWPAIRHNVTDGYFGTMNIRLLAGRTFDRSDRFTEAQVNHTERPERGSVVVSATVARTLWPGQQAIGQAMWLPDIDFVGWREVVGVVADIQFHSVGETPGLHVFVPWTQTATGRPRLLVKTAGDAASIISLVRGIVEQVQPGTRIEAVAPMPTLYAAATAQPRFTSRLVAAFGALALLLAAVGIYGTLSYLVSTQRREIGIRLALGARPANVLSTVLWRGFLPALGGGLVGLGAAIALARVFQTLLFEIEPIDALSVSGGGALLTVVALAAALGPARRASRVDPTIALRSE